MDPRWLNREKMHLFWEHCKIGKAKGGTAFLGNSRRECEEDLQKRDKCWGPAGTLQSGSSKQNTPVTPATGDWRVFIFL